MNMQLIYKNFSQLELLPNEIFFVIFRYFNAQDLFRAFLNLNYRFNQLIQSFNDLHLVYQMKETNYKNSIFSYYVYTLVTNHDVDVNLNQFPNIHRLKLDNISKNILSQLNSSNLPYLKHLALYHEGILKSVDPVKSLHILKLGCNNSLSYTTILSSCPNLRFLDIGVTAFYKHLSNMIFHLNLRQMILRIQDIIRLPINNIMNNYLSCVPNLEQLSIHLVLSDCRIIESYIDYDWFKKIIYDCLPLLQQFNLYLYLQNLNEFNESQIETIKNQMKQNFQIIYNNQYQSRFFIR